jgi:hypothetical protein
MEIEPKRAYVYQPMPPQEDGRFYGVGGLHTLGVSFCESDLRGLTKKDAEKIASDCNESPECADEIVSSVLRMMAEDWLPECGCRFESLFSSAVLVCEECSEHPAHSRMK